MRLRLRAAMPLALAVIGFVCTGSADASENWMFRRSYFSHDPIEAGPVDYPRPISRSAYRPAYRGFGYGVRGVNRINRSVVRSGNSTDYTISGENWVQFMEP
jgi:hypothetical protein